MLKITEEAQSEIQKIEADNPGKKVRVVISGAGWGGPNFGLALDELNEEEVQKFDNIDVLIDKETRLYLQPMTIDCVITKDEGAQVFIKSDQSCC